MSSLALAVYRAAVQALSPVARPWLNARARRGKEDSARIGERFGECAAPRPEGRLVWLHGASVGEMGVLLQVQAALASRDPALNFLISTGTTTSAAIFAARTPPRTRHVFSPLDFPGASARFLTHWRPDLGVFAESELWPNLILAARDAKVPLALINARMSPRTLRRWSRMPAAARELLQAFKLILAADARTQSGLAALSDTPVAQGGNLKLAAAPLSAPPAALAELKAEIGDRPTWLGASTHEGEDEILIAAHERLREEHPEALLILAPRHADRGPRIAPAAPHRSAKQPIADAPIYVADTMGELGLFYAAAPVTLVGGSLLPKLTGHNPIEPAQLGAAILTGPHVESFAEVYDALSAAAGARVVSSATEIAAAVAALWESDAARTALTRAAANAVAAGAASLDTAADALMALIPAPAHATA